MTTLLRRVVLPLALAVTIGLVGLHYATAQDKKDKDKGKDQKAVATFELYQDTAKEFRFRLKDDKGNLLATSGKGYKTKADCQKVIAAIRSDAAKAKLDDMTK
jgi:uncharacterized protein YegP (UPF0339 family)